jgi:capsular exopolysaccharide synthesis family protein
MSLREALDLLLVKQRRLFLIVLVVSFGAAAAVTFLLPKQYEATATLFVGDNRPVATGANSVPLDEVLAQTYRELLATPQIAARVAKQLRLPESTVSNAVSFDIATGTHLIKVTAGDRDPRRAARVANAYAQTFVANRGGDAARRDGSRLASLNRQMDRLAAQAAGLRRSRSPADRAKAIAAQNRLEILRQTTLSLVQNDTLQGSNVTLASGAVIPTTPARPKPKLYLALGAALALLLAAGAAFIANALDRRLRSPQEVAQLFDVPLLATIPAVKSTEPSAEAGIRDALEFLRVNLNLVSDPEEPVCMVAVVGAVAGVGKTFVAANLATQLSRAGESVVAIDADVRRPALARAMAADSSSPGLTDALAGSRNVTDLIRATPSGAGIVPAGSVPGEPALYVTRTRIGRALSDLRSSANYILVDTPPILASAETSIISSLVDGVILVVSMEDADRRALLAARDQLLKSKTRILGVVANRVPHRFGPYAYGYGYGADERPSVKVEDVRSPAPAPLDPQEARP